MGLFAEVFDTARTQTAELAAAKTILMLGALQPEPCELASVHAINSKLLLDECRSPEFYDLIIKGRIRFRCQIDKNGRRESPRDELIRRMGQEQYFLAWPETRDESGGGVELVPDMFEQVRRRLSGEKVSIEDDALAARVESALELFSAIDQSPPFFELPREEFFRRSLQAVVSDIPADDEHHDVAALVSRIATDQSIGGRSAAYRAIEKHANGDTRLLAKDLVNAVYNSSVAHSLGARFLSCRRKMNLGNRFHLAERCDPASITCIEQSTQANENLRRLIARPITWAMIHEAVPHFSRITDYGSAKAKEKLAEKLAGVDPFVRSAKRRSKGLIAAAKVGTTALVATVVMTGSQHPTQITLMGAMVGWFMFYEGAFGYVSELVESAVVDQKRLDVTDRIRTQLNGWLDP